MPREGRSYRKRSRSRSKSPVDSKRSRRSRSRERRRSRERKDRRRSRSHSPRRSRSRERRSRSRDRYRIRKKSTSRERTKERRRSRSRDRRRRSRSKDKNPEGTKAEEQSTAAANKEAQDTADSSELNDFEAATERRRKRVEEWRKEKQKQRGDLGHLVIVPTEKVWNLEDDDDEDDEKGGKKESSGNGVEEEEVDPLDAYMQNLTGSVPKAAGGPKNDEKKEAGTEKEIGKVTIITAVAKKKTIAPEKPKGELMESNADLMEYSSEEEEEGLESAVEKMNRKKKELNATDHEKVFYRKFRRDFYVEVPEIAAMTQDEVDKFREDSEHIKAKGKGCPKPVKTWAQCGVAKRIMETLKKFNYDKPTPIQSQAIPAIMSGRDLIGIAKTGSGKTVAFLLPMIRHIKDQDPLEKDDGPIGVILTPTRELAMQISKECRRFAGRVGLTTVCVYGGTGISEQIADLKRGCDVIVCTPGRMIDMLAANNGRVTNLRRCTYVVLDEADRMFDMGFEPQVMKIIDNVRADRQTVLFSATFPRQMEGLARKILKKPIEVQVGGRSVVSDTVEQHALIVSEDDKFNKLLELLGLYQEVGSVLAFVDNQEKADEVMNLLHKHNYPCLSLHGGIDQYDRDSIISDFKSGICKLLVATSVAARGLDVKELILVVNYDCPNHYEDYVHRCGRTGRAGKKGVAYSFIKSDQAKYCGEIIKGFRQAQTNVPTELQSLWEEYVLNQKMEGKTIKAISGFGGSGYKFDDNEAQMKTEKKKIQRKVLGLEDSDEDEGDMDQQIEDMFSSRKRVLEVNKAGLPIVPDATGAAGPGGVPGAPRVTAAAAAAASAAAVAGAVARSAPLPGQEVQVGQASNTEGLELARRLASRIGGKGSLLLAPMPVVENSGGVDTVQAATLAVLKGGHSAQAEANQISSRVIAEQMAGKLHAKLGYNPKVEEEMEEEAKFQRFEEELEINGFPQNARWKVTSREALATITEYSGAGVTVRGNFYPEGKDPPEDERKLYLAIEATSDMAVQKARSEITRIIKEELQKRMSASYHTNKGRYKVL